VFGSAVTNIVVEGIDFVKLSRRKNYLLGYINVKVVSTINLNIKINSRIKNSNF